MDSATSETLVIEERPKPQVPVELSLMRTACGSARMPPKNRFMPCARHPFGVSYPLSHVLGSASGKCTRSIPVLSVANGQPRPSLKSFQQAREILRVG